MFSLWVAPYLVSSKSPDSPANLLICFPYAVLIRMDSRISSR